ncbi:MAG: translation initiation factor IF-3 [Kiritimatiellae bacterium]|nr:translation initiation factor IF-3 [Kiritimatiellia bacterium]MCR5840399.1 translation initiation factor IF-3 [Kiritimatiellia bacterium]
MAQFTRVNFKIRVPQVRVLDAQGNMLGVMPTRDAQRLADQRGLDLVEITPNAQPPVCKIMDYGKFKYEESIREKQARKAQKVQKVKEIKFHPGTDTNDFNYKLNQIRGFLESGCKVKLTLQYRGRENAHRELGEDVINRVLEELKDECFVEQAPKTLGRVLGALIGPPRKNGPKPQPRPAAPAQPGEIHISVS